ncbi:1669_t:CDS:2 [Ambispora leptoticha]|uniref:1669_t:CDS:1 n=1 Tax=Ambispora leptoticha TaxID=144679 RepID=A0A9N8V4G0_9GLOM|nr:1669_t:CDS:2 [Ambispora leptoticha]
MPKEPAITKQAINCRCKNLSDILTEKESTIAQKDHTIAQKDNIIEQKDNIIAEKNDKIAEQKKTIDYDYKHFVSPPTQSDLRPHGFHYREGNITGNDNNQPTPNDVRSYEHHYSEGSTNIIPPYTADLGLVHSSSSNNLNNNQPTPNDHPNKYIHSVLPKIMNNFEPIRSSNIIGNEIRTPQTVTLTDLEIVHSDNNN